MIKIDKQYPAILKIPSLENTSLNGLIKYTY